MKAPVKDNGHKEAASRLAGLLDMIEGKPLREGLKELLTDPQFLLFLSLGQLPEAIFVPEYLSSEVRGKLPRTVRIKGLPDEKHLRFVEIANPKEVKLPENWAFVKDVVPELADNVPWIRDIVVKRAKLPPGDTGYYSPARRMIQIAEDIGPEEAQRTFFHELQHAAMHRAGIPKSFLGWSDAAPAARAKKIAAPQAIKRIEDVLNRSSDPDAALYVHNIGEILAYGAEDRAFLSAAEQMATKPELPSNLLVSEWVWW